MATASALLIGASGFLLGQQLGGSASSPSETLPKPIVTRQPRIAIPNLRGAAGFPTLSTGEGRRTSRRGP